MRDGIVYVLGTPGSRTVKIGTTTNLRKRLGDIQRMSPVPLEALWTCPGGRDLETQLHRHFKDLRLHGEWFEFRADPVRLVRWAVEDQPWLRPKVSLNRATGAPAAALSPIPRARPRSTPLYLTVAEHIRQAIASGAIPPGSRTPALHTYAAQFSVSYETVKRACTELADHGALVHGSGGYSVPEGPQPALLHNWHQRRAIAG